MQRMFNIKNGYPWWSDARRPPFTACYRHLTLKTADKEQLLCVSLRQKEISFPVAKAHKNISFHHLFPTSSPVLVTFMVTLLSVELLGTHTLKIKTTLHLMNVMFKRYREHAERRCC